MTFDDIKLNFLTADRHSLPTGALKVTKDHLNLIFGDLPPRRSKGEGQSGKRKGFDRERHEFHEFSRLFISLVTPVVTEQ